MSAADLLLVLAALPALCAGGYLFWLTLCSRRLPPLRYGAPHFRYEIVIPAHNDNCTDQTAGLAQAAGARILSREDRTKRSKGYALACAFARILSEGLANALVVVGADTVVSPNLLQAFSTSTVAPKPCTPTIAVRNPFSWRTRLMTIALGSFDALRSLALGLSCGLRGNGMCFSSSLLEEVPHDAASLVEDRSP